MFIYTNILKIYVPEQIKCDFCGEVAQNGENFTIFVVNRHKSRFCKTMANGFLKFIAGAAVGAAVTYYLTSTEEGRATTQKCKEKLSDLADQGKAKAEELGEKVKAEAQNAYDQFDAAVRDALKVEEEAETQEA